MLLTDVVVDGMQLDWAIHVPLMLHIVFLGLDHSRLLVRDHCRCLLLNMLVVLGDHRDHLGVARVLLASKTEQLGLGLTTPALPILDHNFTEVDAEFDSYLYGTSSVPQQPSTPPPSCSPPQCTSPTLSSIPAPPPLPPATDNPEVPTPPPLPSSNGSTPTHSPNSNALVPANHVQDSNSKDHPQPTPYGGYYRFVSLMVELFIYFIFLFFVESAVWATPASTNGAQAPVIVTEDAAHWATPQAGHVMSIQDVIKALINFLATR